MSKKFPLISVIMPVFNAQSYVKTAINSVLSQSYGQWELLVINDGSTDKSGEEIRDIADRRVRYFEQPNSGPSLARNVGLREMRGEYFCFLDADDVMPEESLAVRIEKFLANPQLQFVDGKVVYADALLEPTGEVYVPDFRGEPFPQLLKLSRKCFLGLTWMIKRDEDKQYWFNPLMKYSEDLFFFMLISEGRRYDFVESEILVYRRHEKSSTANIDGLAEGYRTLYREVLKTFHPGFLVRFELFLRIKKIVFLSYAFDAKNWKKALLSLLAK